jgi:asparaginyl-tRNA synthetase
VAEITRIEQIALRDGQEATIRGWLQLKTGKGKLQFLRVRDGSGVIQAVVFQGNVSSEAFEAAKRLPLESSLVVTGIVKADARAPGFPGGYELDVRDVQVVQESLEFPIGPKEHGVEFLMDNRHLWLRSNRQWAILRVRATIEKAMRDWLDDNGFLAVDTPTLSNGPWCPDRRTASRCKGIRRYSFGKASKEGICPVGDAGLRFCHPFPDICWTRFSA